MWRKQRKLVAEQNGEAIRAERKEDEGMMGQMANQNLVGLPEQKKETIGS